MVPLDSEAIETFCDQIELKPERRQKVLYVYKYFVDPLSSAQFTVLTNTQFDEVACSVIIWTSNARTP